MRPHWMRYALALVLVAATPSTGCDPDELEDELENVEDDLDDELDDLEDDLDELEREIEDELGRDCPDAPSGRDREVLDRVGDHLDDLHAAGITGVLAEIDLGRRRALARRGVARRGAPAPVPWNASFRAGSVTKTFVAVVVLQLVGEGRLRLDDTVDTWLPGLVAGNGTDGTRITVRHLLQHTSGLFNYTAMFADITPEWYREHRFRHYQPEELVALALQRPPDFAPGADWSYSNTNYILAGMIVERVTGRTWQVEVRDRIVEPLALRGTYDPYDAPGLRGPHARGYDQFTDGGPLVDVTLLNHTWAGAAGSLVSTTRDISRFLRALRRGQLLRPAEMAEMQRTVLATSLQPVLPGLRYGLGLMQFPTSCGEILWSHFGDTFGYSTRTAVSDDGDRGLVVSLTTNLAGEASLDVLGVNLALLDDAMCAGR